MPAAKAGRGRARRVAGGDGASRAFRAARCMSSMRSRAMSLWMLGCIAAPSGLLDVSNLRSPGRAAIGRR